MSEDPKGYYSTLGIAPTATGEEIKAAYRRQAKSLHPDGNQASGSDEAALKELNEAYSVLRNVEQRAAYDALKLTNLPAIVNQPDNKNPFHEIVASLRDGNRRVNEDPHPQKKTPIWMMIAAVVSVATCGLIIVFIFFSRQPTHFTAGMLFSDCGGCPRMAVIPLGSFIMGVPGDAGIQATSESPAHLVSIGRPIAVSQLLVTNIEFADFLTAAIQQGEYDQRWAATDQDANSSRLLWRIRSVLVESGYELHPVTQVSWAGASAYVKWLSRKTGQHYRLLSESEWEYAARAGTQSKFYFGDDVNQICEYGNVPDLSRLKIHPDWAVVTCTDGYSETAPVGKFKPNAFRLYDMIGNVWEWTEDCWHDNYQSAPSDGSAWLSGGDCSNRVIRGQSYDYLNYQAGVATRLESPAYGQLPSIGFRIARDVNP